ncbi:LysR family transcriptional regulator [Clostridium sp. MCC353]|uniref:LysR family transcriptional regulator n=1 Tax=Clostridium sp. MCC353 TaxID=2592646 RepID=UPI001C02CD66|nr:LysR family transcriptional regulator [Clostridium sp. MCC353]MBT9776602.1 LysR family transcriptional regulator [Clostridium sp. MCC353]
MDIHTLEYFKVVAELEHITEASRKLQIAQPALTRSIRRLEDELGYPLFDHSKNRIILNDNGKLFLRAVDQILNLLQNTKKEMEEINRQAAARITIAIRSASTLLTRPVAEFKKSHPDINFNLMNENTGSFPANADFLLYSSFRPDTGNTGNLLTSEQLYVVVNEQHPLSRQKGVALAELSLEDFILLDNHNDFYDIAVECCSSAGFRPRIAAQTEKSTVLQNLLFENAGISILPHLNWFTSPEHPMHFLEITDVPCRRYIYLVPNPDRYQTAVIKEFHKYITGFYHQDS